jgi:hypothetical protein
MRLDPTPCTKESDTMSLRKLAPVLIALLTLSAARPSSAAPVLYAIGDGGATLLRFRADDPSRVTSVAFSGAATFLDGLDFRPGTGQLYGYLDSTSSVYTVDLQTGVLTLASTLTAPTNTFTLGIDFNPVPDRLRIVTESNQNLRANVDTGDTTVDGDLAYAVGDVNEDAFVRVTEAAYTNSFGPSPRTPPPGTQLYYIDSGLDILATTAAPNDGILNTVGSLGVDTDEFVGFDIFSTGDTNTAYALLNGGGRPSLYTIDLVTGAATLVGALGPGAGSGNAYGLSAAPVPEPTTLLMGATGVLAGLCALRHRRNTRSSRA